MSCGETIYVIVVNWNNADDTLQCLHSLSMVTVPRVRVIVVDNGSTDNSVEVIRQRFPQYAVLELKENRGFGQGCNAAHQLAMSQGADYVVFLNNDTVVDPGFLEPLIAPLRDGAGVAMTVPRIYYMAFPDVLWYAGGEVNLMTGRVAHRGIRERDADRFSLPLDTDYATGCCFAMRASGYSDAGGFDPAFHMYGEDVDLSLRIRQTGGRILYVPSSKVWHRVSASVRGELDMVKLWSKNLSMLRLLFKHRSLPGLLFYLLLAPFRFVQGGMAVRGFKRSRPEKLK